MVLVVVMIAVVILVTMVWEFVSLVVVVSGMVSVTFFIFESLLDKSKNMHVFGLLHLYGFAGWW